MKLYLCWLMNARGIITSRAFEKISELEIHSIVTKSTVLHIEELDVNDSEAFLKFIIESGGSTAIAKLKRLAHNVKVATTDK